MLQPSDSPSLHHLQRPPQAVGLPERGEEERRQPGNLWRWISVRELVFIFVACSVGAALFRTRDSIRYEQAWSREVDTSFYRNKKFPTQDEKLPPPLVTDVDSDGSTDMLYLTPDGSLILETFPEGMSIHSHTHTDPKQMASIFIREFSGGSYPITVATGFLRQYQSMIQVRQQVVVVLTSDWTVLCFNHELKLLWKSQPIKSSGTDIVIREPSLLISFNSIQKGDTGCVLVGGRASNRLKPEDSFTRARRGGKPENSDEILGSLEHYTTVALDGASGGLRWQHTPSDFNSNPAYRPDISSFRHIKLLLHKQLPHEGEVSWHQYSTALRSVLPHSWQRNADTHFQLAHFKKDLRKSEEPNISEHIKRVGGLAADHIAGLAFGGLRPHSSSEHVADPNVLIVHSAKGVDILHLYQGRPLCSVALSPYHAAHADVNGDGTIDHVQAVVNPSEDSSEELSCYGQATPMSHNSKPLFTHSICKATHWSETFIATDKWLPGLNVVGRKAVDHSITEPLAPVLIESSYHSAPLKLHLSLSGVSWTKWLMGNKKATPPASPPSHPHTPSMYDSVFVLSSGRVTSIGPQGEFNWQVDGKADWDSASEVIYNQDHVTWNLDPEHASFIHSSFTPASLPCSLKSFGKKDHILVAGWKRMVVLSSRDGSLTAHLKLPCEPISPAVLVDFTDDGWNDLILTCRNEHIGYVLSRQSGFWHSTVLSMFVGVVIVLVAVYTRQKNVALLPAVKASQD